MKKKYRKIKQRKFNKNRYKRKKFLSIKIFLFHKWLKLVIVILLIFILFIITLIKKRKINNNVHIAINMDIKYIYPFIVYLTSLLDNKNASSFYTVHILTNKKTIYQSKDIINKVIKKFENNSIKIKYYNLEGEFQGATVGKFSLIAYYRISLPSILYNIDKVIYTDIDMINFKDLSEMYNIKFKDNMYICAQLDYTFLIEELKEFGINTEKYINGGIIIFNLKEMRNKGIENKMREFATTHKLKTYDQTAINAICYNNTQILPFKYGMFAFDSINELIKLNNEQNIMYRFNESELIQAFNEPTLFHYCAWSKPWFKSSKNFNRVYWWYYAKMSGFYTEILDYYGFEKKYVEDLLKKIPEDGGLLRRTYKKLA